jgi:hypothetical protein
MTHVTVTMPLKKVYGQYSHRRVLTRQRDSTSSLLVLFARRKAISLVLRAWLVLVPCLKVYDGKSISVGKRASGN